MKNAMVSVSDIVTKEVSITLHYIQVRKRFVTLEGGSRGTHPRYMCMESVTCVYSYHNYFYFRSLVWRMIDDVCATPWNSAQTLSHTEFFLSNNGIQTTSITKDLGGTLIIWFWRSKLMSNLCLITYHRYGPQIASCWGCPTQIYQETARHEPISVYWTSDSAWTSILEQLRIFEHWEQTMSPKQWSSIIECWTPPKEYCTKSSIRSSYLQRICQVESLVSMYAIH